jgi:uracil-DNA glycosylase
MDFDKFKHLFHESWHSKIKPLIESKECDELYLYLKERSKMGHKIAPISSNVYRCFLETPLDEVKLIFTGMCPYHSMKGDMMVADGLLMGCSNTEALQPSLEQFYNSIELEMYEGLSLKGLKNPDVSFLAKQGILMYNAALTTEIGKAGSHNKIWESFTKYMFEEVFSVLRVPIVFLGKDAARFEKYCPPMSWTFSISHPASASYKNEQWDSEGVFKKVTQIVKENNNYDIEWLDVPF